jgi:outer membrane protein assembly factor BamB
MKSVVTPAFLALTLLLACVSAGADDNWNQFRGPNGDGISAATDLPLEFDERTNVRWKVAIPGLGWSSPVVWADEIWLTTGSDKQRELRAICVDLESGKVTRNVLVFDMIGRKIDPAYAYDSPHLNSPATPTPVVEDERVFVSFGSQGIACLDRKTGDKVWERRDLRVYQPVRQGSSPVVDDTTLYVAYDGTDQQFFVALDKATGETRWQVDRNVRTDWEATLREKGFSPKDTGGKPNDNKKSFATATLIGSGVERQLIAPAAEATIAYDPDTGDELWRVVTPGGFNVAARPVFANGLVYVFTSGLTSSLMAIKPDGHGDVTSTHIAWSTTKGTPNIPSPVLVDGLLFMVTDKGGIARCLDAVTGEEIWKLRLGGNHWASPVYADGTLYFCSKEGEVTVVAASRDEPQTMTRSKLNASFIASPAVADSSLILRSTTHLYRIQEGYQRSEAELAREMQTQAVASSKDSQRDDDWDDAYEKLLESNSAVREKIETGKTTKEDVIVWLKQKNNAAAMKSKAGAKAKGNAGEDVASGSVNFYAVVIGRLRTRDIELGEFTLVVDHVSSMYSNRWVKDEIVGKTIRVTGVAGQYLDNLLLIKRGQTLKVRSGSYNNDNKILTFGPKFHVLERTAPFKPEDFGVPPSDFRGFKGQLTGKIVEVAGYEVLLSVTDQIPASDSAATDADSIRGKRVRIVGFYNQHREAFEDLHEGDKIQVSVSHPDPNHDELEVTNVLNPVQD